MVPNSDVITRLILPGNYGTFEQKAQKRFKYSMCQSGKNNLNQQNRQ